MSYDLTIACSDEPDAATLAEAAAGLPDEVVVEGPDGAEPEDLDDSLLPYVLQPRWLLSVHVPYSMPHRYRELARRFARRVARETRGAVFDPQEDAVIWPRRTPKRYTAPAAEERFRHVYLTWFLPLVQAEATPFNLLSAFRATCPETVPVRYGGFEPYRGRLDSDGDAAFVEAWRGAELEFGGSFFWTATPPCFGGHAAFPDKRETLTRETADVVQLRPPRAGRAIRVSTNWDGRALHEDARWCETVVAAFRNVARHLGAFYGAAYVNRNVVIKRGRVGYAPDSESFALQRSSWWLGIPPKPTWLAWFGEPYRDVVQSYLPTAERFPEGLLLRHGTEPMDIDELEGRMPELPAEVLAGPEIETFKHVGNLRLPEVSIEPASWIPDL